MYYGSRLLLLLFLVSIAAPVWGDSTTYFFGSPGTDLTRPDNTEDVTGSAIGLIGNARIHNAIGTRCSTACAVTGRACVCTTLESVPDSNNAVQATFTCRNGGLLTPEELSYKLAGSLANPNQTGTLTLFASRDYEDFDMLDTKVLDNTTSVVTHDLTTRAPTPMEVYELRPQKTAGDTGQSKAVAQIDDLTLTGSCSEDGDSGKVISTGMVKPPFGQNVACAVNEVAGATADVLIEIIDDAGTVKKSSTPTIPAYGSTMLMEQVTVAGGKRWCRVTPAPGDGVRARIYTVRYLTSGSEDGSEAQ